MKKYSRHKILDSILLSLKDTTIDRPVEEGEIYFDLQIHKSTKNRDKLIFIQKLLKDGFIDKHDFLVGNITEKGIYITFEGLLHIEQGGYNGALKRDRLKRFVMSGEKWVIVISLVIAAIYYVIQIYTFYRPTKIP